MTIRELRRRMLRHQEALGLQNWRIQLKWGKIVPEGEATPFTNELEEDCLGHTWWMPESPNAVITVRRGGSQEEHTLVHEMLHILFEGHQLQPRKYDPKYERSLNHVAEAILRKQDLES